jgi:hypothetical protein
MNKKNLILIGIALVLAGIYGVYFTDWFRPKTIHISHTSRPVRVARNGATTGRIFFGLGDYYSLTEVKVIPLAALQTNKLAQPVWHLVSDSGSDDVNQFFYGEKINGMDPAVEGAQPELLQPGVTYRLFVIAGKARGQHDFQLGGPPVSPPKAKSSDD